MAGKIGAGLAMANPVGLIGTAIGGGAQIAGAVGQYMSGKDAANSAQSIADAQLAESRRTQGLAMDAAAPSALELSNMNAQLQQAGTALQRQQKLFDSIDPALMESGKQALALMKGENASTVAPMLAQRQQQRAQLQQQLQQQLGPGAASSSAGAQALANFDLQTSNYQAGLQQQMLGTMLGGAEFGAQSAMASGGQAAGLFGQVGNQAGNIQSRQVGAITNTGQNVINNSGAPFVGALANAQNNGQLFGQIGAMGGQIMGMAGGAMGGMMKMPGGGGAYGGGSTAQSNGYGIAPLNGGRNPSGIQE